MAHTITITIKIWNKRIYKRPIANKRIQIIDELVKDSKIHIPFDKLLYQLLQEDIAYEIKIDDIPVTIYKSYKSGKWLVIEYHGGK